MLNRKTTSRKQISTEDLQKAIMYIYESETPECAMQKHKLNKYATAKKSGIAGEKRVQYALKWLDPSFKIIEARSRDICGNSCIILKNPDFLEMGQEYDNIIVSPFGVILIEIKNFEGKIRIDSFGNWRRIKKGVEKGMRNPYEQIIRHEKLLRSFVPANIPIQSILCIANDYSIIEGINNSSLPIVKSDSLLGYIESLNGKKQVISEDDQIQVMNLIYNHMTDALEYKKVEKCHEQKKEPVAEQTEYNYEDTKNILAFEKVYSQLQEIIRSYGPQN